MRTNGITVYEVTDDQVGGPYIVLGEGWGPLDPEKRTREVRERAGLLVMSPAAYEATLVVTVSPESSPASRPADGDSYEVRLALTPGANSLFIDSPPGERTVISGLQLVP